MSRLRLRNGKPTLVGLAALGLAMASVVLIASSASSASSAPRIESRAKAVPLDHFLCYSATAPNFATPTKVALKNFLNPTPFTPLFGGVSAHCNPTIKRVIAATGTKTSKVRHPNAHLLCWTIAAQNRPQTVALVNQFGKATMVAGSPTKLCLPTWKSKSGPPNKKQVAPPNLDHFACYPLTLLSATSYGFKAVGAITVEDEFSYPKFVGVKIGVANLLCVPTTKSYQGAVYSPISPADLSLVCFPVNKTPFWKVAYDENQFGQAAVFPLAPPEDLCVPSVAKLG
jgi:hypothetical protein